MTTINQYINWPDDLDETVFLRNFWQQKPLLIPGAFPQFENPLSRDELGGLALEDDIHSRLILSESADHWHLQTGPFTESELTSLPRDNWSLLISDVEKHLDGFQTYLQPFRFIPDWRIDDLMISYAPSGASVGAHVDQYDVFLLQASGQRQWSISNRQTDHSWLPDLDIQILANFEPTDTWVLSPGDMLYLPPGVPHHGVSMDDECMTWSIGFRAPSNRELIMDIATQLANHIDEDSRYCDPGLKTQQHPGEINSDALDTLRATWDKLTSVDQDLFKKLTGNVLTQSRSFPGDDASRKNDGLDELVEALREPVVVRSASSRAGFTRLQSGVYLHVDGKDYKVSETLAMTICDGFEYPGDTLNACLTESGDQHCLLDLWNRNLLSHYSD